MISRSVFRCMYGDACSVCCVRCLYVFCVLFLVSVDVIFVSCVVVYVGVFVSVFCVVLVVEIFCCCWMI